MTSNMTLWCHRTWMAGKSLINEILDGVEKTSISDGFYMAMFDCRRVAHPISWGGNRWASMGYCRAWSWLLRRGSGGAQLVSSNFTLTLKPSPATYFQQPTCLNKLHARKKENVHAVPISMKIDEKQKGPNPKETSAFEPILIMHLQIKNISFTILVI